MLVSISQASRPKFCMLQRLMVCRSLVLHIQPTFYRHSCIELYRLMDFRVAYAFGRPLNEDRCIIAPNKKI